MEYIYDYEIYDGKFICKIGSSDGKRWLRVITVDKDGNLNYTDISDKYQYIITNRLRPSFALAESLDDYYVLRFDRDKNMFVRVSPPFDKKFLDFNIKFLDKEINIIKTDDQIYVYDEKNGEFNTLAEGNIYDNGVDRYILVEDKDNDGKLYIIDKKSGKIKNILDNLGEIVDRGYHTASGNFLFVHRTKDNTFLKLVDLKNGTIDNILKTNANDKIRIFSNFFEKGKGTIIVHEDKMYVIKNNKLVKIHDNSEEKLYEHMIDTDKDNNIVFKIVEGMRYAMVYSVDSRGINELKNNKIKINNKGYIVKNGFIYNYDDGYLYRVDTKNNTLRKMIKPKSDLSDLRREFLDRKTNYIISEDENLYFYNEKSNKLQKVKTNEKLEYNSNLHYVGNKNSGILIFGRDNEDVYHLYHGKLQKLFKPEITWNEFVRTYVDDDIIIADVGVIKNYDSENPKVVVAGHISSYIYYSDFLIINMKEGDLLNEKKYSILIPHCLTTNKDMKKQIKLDGMYTHIRDNIGIMSTYDLFDSTYYIAKIIDDEKIDIISEIPYTVNDSLVSNNISDYLISEGGLFHIPTETFLRYNVYGIDESKIGIIKTPDGKFIHLLKQPLPTVVDAITKAHILSLC